MNTSRGGIQRGIFLVLFVLILLGAFYSILDRGVGMNKIPPHSALITIHNTPDSLAYTSVSYMAELATTEEEQTKGLGGRQSLALGTGMLFVFPEPGSYGFWMKDTLIPLDMIWIAADKHIVTIAKDVQPSSYPSVYSPDEEAQYVLEVSAGEAEKNHFAVGDTVSFTSSELH